jgi:hypothetical protein
MISQKMRKVIALVIVALMVLSTMTAFIGTTMTM